MSRIHPLIVVCLLLLTAPVGCRVDKPCTPNLACNPGDLLPNSGEAGFLPSDRVPCLDEEACEQVDAISSPLDLTDYESINYQELTLQDAISFALQNSKVFRDLGGNVLRSPSNVVDIYDPAGVYTDPRFSEEAALAAFDANFVASAFFQKNDRPANLTFQGNNGVLTQDAHQYLMGFRKLAATGTFFSLTHGINYDHNNQIGTIFGQTSWESIVEGEFRHPLLQGGGVQFNRIAGPSNEPGVYNGVLIARTNTEISLLEFRKGVRDLISEVENAYWDLYFAYRNLEANIRGRDKAYDVYLATKTAAEGGRESTQAAAQAKEQYQRFRAIVLDAMEGRLGVGTRNNNGAASGVFQSSGGVRVAERRLRLVTGLPINSGALLKPSEEPTSAGITFDWDQAVSDAFENREELLQQKWLIKQKELELCASKNFLQPRFDVVGQYRLRGLGEDLMGGSRTFNEQFANNALTSTAYGDLLGRDFQEWQLGAEVSVPIGYRRAHLGVRNAEIAVSRERALYREQKREIVYGLSNAVSEMRRAFTAMKANEERFIAAKEFQEVMNAERDRGRDRDIELEAQRRVVESEIQYRQSQVEYALALKNVHVEKGTFLQFCNVRLTESVSNPKASSDAAERASRFGGSMSYLSQNPIIASQDAEELANGSPIEIGPVMEPTPTEIIQPVPNAAETTFPGLLEINEANGLPGISQNTEAGIQSTIVPPVIQKAPIEGFPNVVDTELAAPISLPPVVENRNTPPIVVPDRKEVSATGTEPNIAAEPISTGQQLKSPFQLPAAEMDVDKQVLPESNAKKKESVTPVEMTPHKGQGNERSTRRVLDSKLTKFEVKPNQFEDAELAVPPIVMAPPIVKSESQKEMPPVLQASSMMNSVKQIQSEVEQPGVTLKKDQPKMVVPVVSAGTVMLNSQGKLEKPPIVSRTVSSRSAFATTNKENKVDRVANAETRLEPEANVPVIDAKQMKVDFVDAGQSTRRSVGKSEKEVKQNQSLTEDSTNNGEGIQKSTRRRAAQETKTGSPTSSRRSN